MNDVNALNEFFKDLGDFFLTPQQICKRDGHKYSQVDPEARPRGINITGVCQICGHLRKEKPAPNGTG